MHTKSRKLDKQFMQYAQENDKYKSNVENPGDKEARLCSW